MVWILAATGIAVAIFLAFHWGFLPPLNATTLIRFRDGKLEIPRGHIRIQAREQIADLLREAQVPDCFMAITPRNRVVFSRHIPIELHQRLRNVIINQGI